MSNQLFPSDKLDTVVMGDCLQVMADLPDRCVDLILTDPPYFLPAQHYATRKHFTRSLADASILDHFFTKVFGEIDRILKHNGVLYMFCDGQSYPLFYVLSYPNFKGVRPLIWDKVISFNGYSWRHQHELVLFGERPEAPVVKTGDGDVIRFRAVPVDDRDHPAEKPEPLVSAFIRKSSEEDQVVFDPFLGSGTTAVAALKLGRHFYGCDINPDYVRLANERIEKTRLEMSQMELL